MLICDVTIQPPRRDGVNRQTRPSLFRLARGGPIGQSTFLRSRVALRGRRVDHGENQELMPNRLTQCKQALNSRLKQLWTEYKLFSLEVGDVEARTGGIGDGEVRR